MKKKLVPLKKFASMQLEAGQQGNVRGGENIKKSWEDYHTVEGDGSNIGDHSLDTRVIDYCISL